MNKVQLQKDLDNLLIKGRNEFYTELLLQEIPMFYDTIVGGNEVSSAEVEWLIKRRGFNEKEAGILKQIAELMNRQL